MELETAIKLIEPAAERFIRTSSWADLGCGTGLFTRALAYFLQEGSNIYAVDRNKKNITGLKLPGHIHLEKLVNDFMLDVLPLNMLDGVLMANSLHFVSDKTAFLQKLNQWLKHDACFLLIEYDMDLPNAWVPYPLSFHSATKLFLQSGYVRIANLGMQPSLYNRAGIYAALIER